MKIAKNGVSVSLVPNRNPVIKFGNETVLFIGDPHLGKRFITGVPDNRIGERELMVQNKFKELLNQSNHTYIFICGDLFDRFSVSTTVMFDTYTILLDAITSNPNVTYIVYPGNHDLSKDVTKRSSYVIVKEMLGKHNNLHFILDVQQFFSINDDKVRLYVDTYSPFSPPTMQSHLMDTFDPNKLNILVGHFDEMDLSSYAYVPSIEYVNQFDAIISGHIHTPKLSSFEGSNTPVLFTGSLQPYSHGEDPDKELYVTYTIESAKKVNLPRFKNKNIRLIVPPGYNKGIWFECLSISYMLQEDVKDEGDVLEDDTSVSDSYMDRLLTAIESSSKIDSSIKDSIKQDLKQKVYDESN